MNFDRHLLICLHSFAISFLFAFAFALVFAFAFAFAFALSFLFAFAFSSFALTGPSHPTTLSL